MAKRTKVKAIAVQQLLAIPIWQPPSIEQAADQLERDLVKLIENLRK